MRNPGSTTIETANSKLEQQAIDLLATGRLYVWRGLSIEVKAGAAVVNSVTHNNWSTIAPEDVIPTQTYVSNHSLWRFEPELAIGGGWLIGHGLSIVGIYTHIFGNPFAANPSMNGYADATNTPGYGLVGVFPSDTLSAGLTYHFG